MPCTNYRRVIQKLSYTRLSLLEKFQKYKNIYVILSRRRNSENDKNFNNYNYKK